MIRIVFSLFLFSASCFANASEPTLAEGSKSVLLSSNDATTEAAPTVAPAPQAVVATVPCATATAKEVKLNPWQARRLLRQAERQEERERKQCCKCECKKDRRQSALVLTKPDCCACN